MVKGDSTARVRPGIGVPLWCNVIERGHNQIGVQSAPAQGSTIWFTLPLTQDGSPGDNDM